MNPVRLDIDEGGHKWLGFAKKKLGQLKQLAALTGVPNQQKKLEFDGNQIYVSTGLGQDRIRITSSGAPWFFYRTSFDTGTDPRLFLAYTGRVLSPSLERVSFGIINAFGYAPVTVRGVGKSFSFLWQPSGAGKFLLPNGTLGSISDPLGVQVGSLFFNPVGEYGRSRKGVCWFDASHNFIFTDGSVAQASAPSGLSPANNSAGVRIVGGLGTEDAYYWRVAFSGAVRRFTMYIAERSQPVNSDGDAVAITPILVQDHIVDLTYVPDTTLRTNVISNDYDVLTVMPVSYPPAGAPGAYEIRVNGVLYWSSPGTETYTPAPNPFSLRNFDDAWVHGISASADMFYVALGNYASTVGGGQYLTIALRLLTLTRQVDGTYSVSSSSMVAFTPAGFFSASIAVFPEGCRLFVTWWGGLASFGVDEIKIGWVNFQTGTFTAVHNFGPFAGFFPSAFGLVPLQESVQAVIRLGNSPSSIAFSDSEALDYIERAIPGASVLSSGLQAITGDESQAYVLVTDVVVGGLSYIVSYDGTVNFQTKIGGTNYNGFTHLVVDESTRKISAFAFTSLNATKSRVWRCDVEPPEGVTQGEAVEFPPEPEFVAGTLFMPTLSEHYRRRLLEQWAAEDAE